MLRIVLDILVSDKPLSGNSLVDKIKQQIAAGKWKAATDTWGDLEGVISTNTNSVVCLFHFISLLNLFLPIKNRFIYLITSYRISTISCWIRGWIQCR